jgi:hypothetical protein
MKALARRPRDVREIEGILERHTDMDMARVREMLGQIAEALDDPSLLTDFDALVARARRPHA